MPTGGMGHLAGETAELAEEIAGLPSERDPEAEEAKRFDLLLLESATGRLLRAEPAFERLRDQVKEIAGLLEEKSAIPMVRDQMVLIQDIQTDEWWLDVTLPMLESVRRKLRDLVRLIEKQKRKPIFTDFADQMGSKPIELPGFIAGESFEKFRAKAQAFLREQRTIWRSEAPDERCPDPRGPRRPRNACWRKAASAARIKSIRASERSHGLGLFVRSLVGLGPRGSEDCAWRGSSPTRTLRQSDRVCQPHRRALTEHGVMEAALPVRVALHGYRAAGTR